MRFKQWLEDNYVGTPMANGGMGDTVGYGNASPILSKYVTNNGSSKLDKDGADGKIKPNKLFGFRTPEDRKISPESGGRFINKNNRRVPVERIPPDIIY